MKLADYPERNFPKGAVFQAANAVNRVLLVAVRAGEPVLNSKLSAATSAEGPASTISWIFDLAWVLQRQFAAISHVLRDEPDL